jgi:UPF0755 protein
VGFVVGKVYFRQILSQLSRICSLTINTFVFLFILAIPITAFFAFDYFKSPGPLLAPTTVVIEEGIPMTAISQQLAKSAVINYPELFTFIMRLSESEKKMKAGEYSFNSNVTPIQVYHKISTGDVVTRYFTIPEGLMTSQILAAINKVDILKGEVTQNIAEGELLPETYDYYYGENREKIINRMRVAMTEVLKAEWEKRAAHLPFTKMEEALVMASIVEKETGIKSERKRVAAVFINRLRKNMRLQTDPSVIYAITKGAYVLNRPLNLDDLQVDSPYNTYKNSGLPPTPISNPGKASIEAVLNPDETNELYFVAGGTGGHKFAATLKEHNKNVLEWRKINGKKND